MIKRGHGSVPSEKQYNQTNLVNKQMHCLLPIQFLHRVTEFGYPSGINYRIIDYPAVPRPQITLHTKPQYAFDLFWRIVLSQVSLYFQHFICDFLVFIQAGERIVGFLVFRVYNGIGIRTCLMTKLVTLLDMV